MTTKENNEWLDHAEVFAMTFTNTFSTCGLSYRQPLNIDSLTIQSTTAETYTTYSKTTINSLRDV